MSLDLSSITSCRGVDTWQSRLFITSNEGNQKKTLQTLSKHPLNGNAMLGVSGFFLLDAAAVRPAGIDTLILVDNSTRVADFWDKMKPIIANAANRHTVAESIKDLLNENKIKYYSGEPNVSPNLNALFWVKRIEEEIGKGDSWLSSDDKFNRIQEIFKANRFVFKMLDIADTASIEKLTSLLPQQGVTLDSVYLSNVAEFMYTDAQKESFKNSVEKLVGPKTLTILTKPRNCDDCDPLEQHVVRKPAKGKIDPKTFFPSSKQCTSKNPSTGCAILRKVNDKTLTEEKMQKEIIQSMQQISQITNQANTRPSIHAVFAEIMNALSSSAQKPATS